MGIDERSDGHRHFRCGEIESPPRSRTGALHLSMPTTIPRSPALWIAPVPSWHSRRPRTSPAFQAQLGVETRLDWTAAGEPPGHVAGLVLGQVPVRRLLRPVMAATQRRLVTITSHV